jgi:hypothetical protein
MESVIVPAYVLFLVVMPALAWLSMLTNQTWLLLISLSSAAGLCLIFGCMVIHAIWTWLRKNLAQAGSSPIAILLVILEGLVLLAGIWLLSSAGMHFISQ